MTAPVYLYTGPEAGNRNDAVESIKASLKKKYGDIEEYLYYASETPVQDFMAVLQNESLFASCTCVVVKAVEVLKKKEEIEIITSWISNCNSETSVLILISDEISVDTKLEKAIPPANKKIFWEMFEDQKLSWLTNYFSKNGYKIQEEACELILEMIENNTEQLKKECSRFFILFEKDHIINVNDVDAVLTHTREENAFSLFGAMAEANLSVQERFEKALEILQKIRLSKDNSPQMIIAGLASCFRKLVLWQTLAKSGKNDDFNLKINGFSSKNMKSQYSNASRIWTQGQATAILANLAQIDMNIRSTGTLLVDSYLENMIYETVIKKGARSASYETDL